MRRVLVTHADSPIGRRVVKLLCHDEGVDFVLAVGAGPPPRAFDRYLTGPGPRFDYARVDLAKYRPVSDLFHSEPLRATGVDAVVYVPNHGDTDTGGERLIAGLDERTEETRLLVQPCLESSSLRPLVAVGRRPTTEGLGLERVGVRLDERGNLVTDEHLATTASGIYAAGDVTGRMLFTHAAFEMGLAQGINFERRLFHGLFGTEDQKEGMTAFVEKRPGNWTGK